MAAAPASPELFRTSTFAIVEGGETLGLAYFVVERAGDSFVMIQCDLDSAGKVWNSTPCFRFADFEAACARAVADAGPVFVS